MSASFRVSAIRSPTTTDHRYLLVYWLVYSTFDYIEFILRHLIASVMFFYVPAKFLFLIWFLSSGSKLIVTIFRRDPDQYEIKIPGEY